MRILVTGAAGFIGSHVCERLIRDGHDVIGLDAFIPYYPRSIKECNLAFLRDHSRFQLVEADLRHDDLELHVAEVDAVIHEAAMAGPASWDQFGLYTDCNLVGTQRLLEAIVARRDAEKCRFVQISTSSVYGVEACGDEMTPLRPASPYGITKLAAEQLALAYGRAFGMPVVALRYFSIYGPRQRPDMAYHIFINALLHGEPITINGDGSQTRGNTYIDDCVEGTIRALTGGRPDEVYNIGGGVPISLNRAIEILEEALEQKAERRFLPPRRGDQRHTLADTSKAQDHFGYVPCVPPEEGLRHQVAWQRALASRRIGTAHADVGR